LVAQAPGCGSGTGGGSGAASGAGGSGTGAAGSGGVTSGGSGGSPSGGAGGAGGVGGVGGATGGTGGGTCTEGQTQSCYTGPPGTDGVGICAKGTQDCVAGSFGPCNGEVLPAESELCNDQDDDCNGLKDEGLGQTTCGQGTCTATVENCKDGKPVTCVPGTPNAVEACDGQDDNCNGQVDETCSCVNGKTQSCYTGAAGTAGVGLCKTGTQTCAGGKWGSCSGEVVPTAELCNGQDDDCDGTKDEGQPESGDTCDTGKVGECKIGVTSCLNGIKLCNQVNTASPEVCDGKDNNCNGTTDDGNPEGGKTCNTGKFGVCAAGTTDCKLGGVVCEQNVQPSLEVCDGADNDCDNLTDEGNPGGNQPCSTGLQGVCANGTTACTSGAIKCNQNVQSSTETCDGADNDCDGQTDEGCQCVNGATQSCYTGAAGTSGVGLCKSGLSTCSNGLWGTCLGQVTPKAETCNNKDDDCDGPVDEGNPGGGAACSTGKLGICAAGTMTCTAGVLSCKQNQQAGTELCGNSLDDDCDGQVNEGCSIVTGQIIHYELEQTTGTVVPNLAPGKPAGTIVGTYTWLTPGGAPTSSARHLQMASTGTNAVSSGLASTPLTNVTIEFWWKWSSGTSLSYMWQLGAGGFRAFTNGVAYAGIYVRSTPGGTDVVYAPSVQDNAWHHIAYVLNASTSQATLYVDGAAAGTSAYSGSITLDSTFYVLGQNGANGALVGYDRYRVWSQALTAAQITAIKNGTM
jgi:hypothetical protein